MLKKLKMEEVWNKHFEFKDLEFSSLGRIRRNGGKPYINSIGSDGYVYFTYNNKRYSIHRIVADLFCYGKSNEKKFVDHINRLRHDNRVENLRWVTSSENNKNREFRKLNEVINVNMEYKDLFLKKSLEYNNLYRQYIELHSMYVNSIKL